MYLAIQRINYFFNTNESEMRRGYLLISFFAFMRLSTWYNKSGKNEVMP